MPLSAGHADAVEVIEVAFKAARDNPQGEDNIRLIAEAIVNAIEKKLLPKALVIGKTTTYFGPQELQDGKVT